MEMNQKPAFSGKSETGDGVQIPLKKRKLEDVVLDLQKDVCIICNRDIFLNNIMSGIGNPAARLPKVRKSY
jgi:hypothetical protein